jgi:fumarate hydratase, class I
MLFVPYVFYLRSPDTEVIQVNLNRPMKEVLAELSQYPIRTRLQLSGTLVVARDIAHAKLKERIDAGQGLPQYVKVGYSLLCSL